MRRARLGRVLTVGWLVVLGAHAWVGGRVTWATLGAHRPLPSGPNATSDLWLKRSNIGATTTELQTLLARIPAQQDIIFVVARSRPAELPAWPFVSYVAWPHPVWVYECAEGMIQPQIFGPDPVRVPWLLYLDVRPPRAFRRVGVAGRLRLVAADPSVPWTSYCSS